MNVSIKEYAPSPSLQGFIECYWHATYFGSRTAVIERKIVPSGFIELILHLTSASCEVSTGNMALDGTHFFLAGLWTNPYLVRFKDKVEVFAIRFKPEAMNYMFNVRASHFVNNPADLQDVLDADFRSLCLRIEETRDVAACVAQADTYFQRKAFSANRCPKYLLRASEIIRNNCSISVEGLSDEVCISKRQLERQFKETIGMSPKTYLRINRLNKALSLLQQKAEPSFSELSYLAGYFDQAHFIKDFKEFTGEAPTSYLSRPENFLS